MKLDDLAGMQLWWGVVNLRVVHFGGASLTDPLEQNVADALVLHSDAAGGGSTKWKEGGCYWPEKGEMVRGECPNIWTTVFIKGEMRLKIDILRG